MEFCRDDLVLEVVFGFGAAGPLASVREKFVVVALVVAGFMVAYAAMFGFDKLKEVMNWNSSKS